MEPGLICCYGARSWTRVIAWIQIVSSAVGLFLSGGGLIVLFLESDAVDEPLSEEKNKSIPNDSLYNSEWSKSGFSQYLLLVIILLVCVVVLLLGIILGVFLLKGANERNGRYLKCWVAYAVIMLLVLVLGFIASAENTWVLVVQLSVVVFLYGFSLTMVILLIREIDLEQQYRRDESSGSNNKYSNAKAYPTKV